MPHTAGRPVIALELNELCPPLLDRWMREGLLPNFRRLHDSSDVFETEADVADPACLEPWIQWYSIHTGLAYDQHGVFHLTDGRRAGHEDIWQAVIGAGRSAFSFSSMNVRAFSAPGSLYVGDPWTEDGDASPAELNIYNRFVSHNVREYSNPDQQLTASDYAAFLRFLVTHGLSAGTAWQTLRQLASEKLKASHLSYRRVAILDALQYDVFAHYYRAARPAFASFFVNSVAHLQHSYWRHMDPEAFPLKPSEEERARYGHAIRFGYQAMDGIIGRFLKLADRHGATLVFQSALSQQPFLKQDDTGGQHFFRLRNPVRFLADIGLRYTDVDPTMTSQYMLTFEDNHARDAARARLEDFSYPGAGPAFDFPDHVSDRALYFGPVRPRSGAPELVVDAATGRSFATKDILYELDATKSGCHHPVGALWIRTGQHRRHESRVSILDTFPTLVDLMGVDVPANPERRGASLYARMAGHSAAA
jgi:hypothetical protein